MDTTVQAIVAGGSPVLLIVAIGYAVLHSRRNSAKADLAQTPSVRLICPAGEILPSSKGSAREDRSSWETKLCDQVTDFLSREENHHIAMEHPHLALELLECNSQVLRDDNNVTFRKDVMAAKRHAKSPLVNTVPDNFKEFVTRLALAGDSLNASTSEEDLTIT